MKCSDYQDLILQNLPGYEEHLKNCMDCRQFLDAQKTLYGMEAEKTECPDHLQFENLFEKARKKPAPAIRFKWAIPAAAAILLILTYLPFGEHHQVKTENREDITILSESISSEFSELASEIEDMEKSLLTADLLISNEIESLQEEINNLYPEV